MLFAVRPAVIPATTSGMASPVTASGPCCDRAADALRCPSDCLASHIALHIREFFACGTIGRMAFDPAQRFLDLVPGGQGIFYAIQSDGVLLWYRNLGWQTGAATWANGGSGLQIGIGWHQFVKVMAAADGQIFALNPDGTLLWYQYILSNIQTGAGSWHPNSGAQIGSGFNAFPRMFGGWNNILYGVDGNGALFWYRYIGPTGSINWANGGSGRQIGSGWKGYPDILADPNGVIYAVFQSDEFFWYRYVVQNLSTGAGFWVNGGNGIPIGVGWGSEGQRIIAANTSGVLYAVDLDVSVTPGTDNALVWYQLSNSETINTSGVRWANNGNAATVGSGFTIQAEAALQGYPSLVSVPQGGSVGIQVSTTVGSYTSTVMLEAPAASGPIQISGPTSQTGQLKVLPNGYRSAGCGWSTDFAIAVPTSWQSGIYSVRLRSTVGKEFPVVFVVRPATPTNRIAVVVPINTYNAYNTWGGHDQYTVGQDGVQRTITLQRPSLTTAVTNDSVINHTLYSDLFLLRWMTSQNIAYDCYTDLDLDATGATWLPSYKAVVLLTHGEYFTQTARQNILNYELTGGRTINTGANAIYEEVSYTPSRTAVVYRDSSGDRNLFENYGESQAEILGVNTNIESYMTFAPYQVVNQHPFLNGTGLSVGSRFGAVAYNGAASGWEVDETSGSPTVTIATGLNPSGGADMVYTALANNGFVFSASSLSFNGAIPYDSAIQQILRNVFAAAVA